MAGSAANFDCLEENVLFIFPPYIYLEIIPCLKHKTTHKKKTCTLAGACVCVESCWQISGWAEGGRAVPASLARAELLGRQRQSVGRARERARAPSSPLLTPARPQHPAVVPFLWSATQRPKLPRPVSPWVSFGCFAGTQDSGSTSRALRLWLWLLSLGVHLSSQLFSAYGIQGPSTFTLSSICLLHLPSVSVKASCSWCWGPNSPHRTSWARPPCKGEEQGIRPLQRPEAIILKNDVWK